MRRPLQTALLVALLAAPLVTLRADDPLRVASTAPAASSLPPHVPGEVIVQFFGEGQPADVEAPIRAAGGVRARRSAFGARYLVTLDEGVAVPAATRRFLSMPEVDYAEPNGTARALFRPNDRLFALQWHMQMLGAERAWDIQRGDPSVIVAVLDTGIAYEDFGPFRRAPDWDGTVFVPGFNVLTGTSHANDDNFHGTHVASTVAEATDNVEGVTGLCFGCALMPVKVLDDQGNGSFFDVAEGVDFAVARRARVLNLSLGGRSGSETLRRAIGRAVRAGAAVVAAAGNDGAGSLDFPASLDDVIGVGAVDLSKRRSPYSNFGEDLDVVAPGGDLDRDDNFDGHPDGVLQQTFDPRTAALFRRYDDFAFFFVVGTSQATPHVSALAALLMRQGITDPRAVQAAIEQTAEDLGPPGRDDTYGHGLIRPAAALSGLGFNQ